MPRPSATCARIRVLAPGPLRTSTPCHHGHTRNRHIVTGSTSLPVPDCSDRSKCSIAGFAPIDRECIKSTLCQTASSTVPSCRPILLLGLPQHAPSYAAQPTVSGWVCCLVPTPDRTGRFSLSVTKRSPRAYRTFSPAHLE